MSINATQLLLHRHAFVQIFRLAYEAASSYGYVVGEELEGDLSRGLKPELWLGLMSGLKPGPIWKQRQRQRQILNNSSRSRFPRE